MQSSRRSLAHASSKAPQSLQKLFAKFHSNSHLTKIRSRKKTDAPLSLCKLLPGMKTGADKNIIEELQKRIRSLQGNRQSSEQLQQLGLGELESSFPDKVFPRASIHELISESSESAACTSAFISIVLGKLLQQGGFCAWIGTQRTIFPPALKAFGIDPDRILFIDPKKVKDTLWAMEEALKCNALTAVVGELKELSFEDSRRLQLAVEQSRVTGLVHRLQPTSENAVACVSRWKIRPIESASPDGLPGTGFPAWNIKLVKVRNGKTGEWNVQWSPKGLDYIHKQEIFIPYVEREIA